MSTRDPLSDKRRAACNTCTIRLVRIAYARAPWFRLVREPMRLAMRGLAWLYRLDPTEYEVRAQSCYGCLRFYKTALKERSALFRWLNDRVNPTFDALLERIVTVEEVEEAQAYAHQAMAYNDSNTLARLSPNTDSSHSQTQPHGVHVIQ